MAAEARKQGIANVLVSKANFAKMHSVTTPNLAYWRKKGLLVLTPSGNVRVEKSDANLKAAGLGRFGKPTTPNLSADAKQLRKNSTRATKAAATARANGLKSKNARKREASVRADIAAGEDDDVTTEIPSPSTTPLRVYDGTPPPPPPGLMTQGVPPRPAYDSDLDSPLDEMQLQEFLNNLAKGVYVEKFEAERIKENALAGIRLLDQQQRAGQLIDMAVAKRIFFATAHAERDAWLNWPARVGPRLAAELGLQADILVDALQRLVTIELTERGEADADFDGSTH